MDRHEIRVQAPALLFVIGCLTMLTACGGNVAGRVHKGTVDSVIDQKPDQRGYFEALGIGASDPSMTTDTQRKALARDAAIVKAQYELLSMIKGVTLEGGVTVQRAIETDSSLATRISAVIKDAEIVKSEFTSDNGCVVTLRLPKSKVEQSAGIKFK